MDKICRKPKELAEALKNQENEIIIEGDLKNHVIRIKAVGNVSWGVCAASLAAAIALYHAALAAGVIAAPGASGAAFAAGTVISAAAASSLGTAVVPAILIGAASGSVGALTKLRDKYKITEKTKTYIKLKRKSSDKESK